MSNPVVVDAEDLDQVLALAHAGLALLRVRRSEAVGEGRIRDAHALDESIRRACAAIETVRGVASC